MSKFPQASAATITALLSLGLLLLSAPVSADLNQSLMDKFAIADVVAQYAYIAVVASWELAAQLHPEVTAGFASFKALTSSSPAPETTATAMLVPDSCMYSALFSPGAKIIRSK